MRNGNLNVHDSHVFLLRADGFAPGSNARNGAFGGADGLGGYRNGGNENCVDFLIVSAQQNAFVFVYILSGFMDFLNTPAGSLPLFCAEENLQAGVRKSIYR